MRFRTLGLLLAGLLLGGVGIVAGRTDASFRSAPDNAGNSFSVAPDFVPPAVIRTAAADPDNGPSYAVRRCRFYYAYAEAGDTGNPASGVAAMTANMSALTAGAGAEALVAGSYTLGGNAYGWRSLPLLATGAAGAYTYALTSTDGAANTAVETGFPATVTAGSGAAAAVFLTGMEQGAASSALPGVFDAVVGSGVSADGATARYGNYSLRVAPANAAAYASVTLGGGSSTAVVRFALRFAAVPAATANLFAVVPSGGSTAFLAYDAASGRLGVRWGAGAITAGGTALEAGTWYVVEMRVGLGSPHTLEWRLDGAEQAIASTAEAARTVTGLQFGTPATNVTYTVNFDDALVSLTSADYPLGNGKVLALAVDGVGTHNSPGSFRDDDNSAIDAGSWTRVDDVPATSSTDYVKQTSNGTSAYLEFTFADTTETCINAVGARLAYHAAGSSANNGKTSIFNGTAENVVYSGDMSVTTLSYKRSMVSAGSGAWTSALVNALIARVGYASDRNPNPYWDALLLEYDVPVGW